MTPAGPALLNDQPFKLGLFATNLTGGLACTTADGVHYPTWENNVRLAQVADRAGFEAIIPVCRWKGFGGLSDWHGTSFETMTWAAGLAGVTSHAMLVATAHVPAIHPVQAAKAAATIDHISGGRFAFNIVAGWYKDELELFGSRLLDHDGRYSQAAEWMTFVKQLWSSDSEFDFEGRFYNAEGAVGRPKPVQEQPLIINAASSDRGMEFAAAHADVVFTGAPAPTLRRSLTTGDMRAHIDKLRDRIRQQEQREVVVLTAITVTCRDTEREARQHWDYVVKEKGDRVAITNWLRPKYNSDAEFEEAMAGEAGEAVLHASMAGQRTPQAIGTPAQVAEYLVQLSEAGYDGTTISFLADWDDELERFIGEILPLLEQAGIRTPFVAEAHP